jgi:hypothetical protein
VLLGLVAVGGAALLLTRRRRREREDEELTEVKAAAREDVAALGEAVRALAPAGEEHAQALEAYDHAHAGLEQSRHPEDLEPVGAALEAGRFALACAQARTEGRTPPEHRPPCLFDPRHGPSARDVEWAPDGADPRLVPACEADAQRIERGEDPEAREVTSGGRHVPYWEAGPAFAPYAGGFFGGLGGGRFGALMAGTPLAAALWAGMAWGDESLDAAER